MGKKEIGIIIAVLVLIALVPVYFLTMSKPAKPVTSSKTDTTSASDSAIPAGKVTELKIEDSKVGTGPAVQSGDTVVMHYNGTLMDGTKFDSSYDRGEPFTTQIGVGQVIEGWDQGVPGMKVGGKRKLTIPSEMAYGSRGAGAAIPPNSDLIFEVELIAIKD